MTEAVGVVALSARMMAESARRGGFATTAIDVFGDTDTRAAAKAWWSAGDAQALRLEEDRVVRALEALVREPAVVGWIPGGGFEAAIDMLARCARVAPLLGNRPETFAAVRTARAFFARLAALGIDHPDVAWERPDDARRWLVKDAHGSGGWHIRAATEDRRVSAASARYFQRIHAGVPMSALFVANGEECRVVGINSLIVARRGRLPYVYHGAIGPVPIDDGAMERLCAHIDAIVRSWQLTGLNGIDFLLDTGRIVVLEINPRPTATMMLHDDAVPHGLIRAHVDACRFGRLPDASPTAGHRTLRGHAIVFAEDPVTMTPMLQAALIEPGPIHDVPALGTKTGRGAPFCSVSASGATIESVRVALAARAARVIERVRHLDRAAAVAPGAGGSS